MSNFHPKYKSASSQAVILKECHSRLKPYGFSDVDKQIKYIMQTSPTKKTSLQASKVFVQESGKYPIFGNKACDFCEKIYGKKVKNWSLKKQIDTYNNLMANEINNIFKSGRINRKKI